MTTYRNHDINTTIYSCFNGSHNWQVIHVVAGYAIKFSMDLDAVKQFFTPDIICFNNLREVQMHQRTSDSFG
jgi:hypothetical protein